ncbi:MAG: erythromycin biosynthesis sensory transduction protein eryC1 [Verrucomicrobia bacterium]|nr:MAG: erythromycin biosynthesis sensory transduction protein eryC1 [Verrucomicrobiota bacterium]PYJ99307.1 MAG: erythromycin biosynthesis sensory transduction protein eryC1 [Verrucomicrobiota bacterium]
MATRQNRAENKTTVPYVDLQAQYRSIRSEVLKALEEVCESARFVQGPKTSKFEEEFAAYCGVNYCVSLNSGTSALHLALRCLDIGPGDEVITVAMSFIATAWAISYVGATPVFVDIDAARRTMSPTKLEAAITPRTKAIIPVHLYGMPAEMDRINAIAVQHGIPIIEDAAQAHGARYRGKRVGQFGKIACFSFYPGKNLGAYGEGGALTTNDTLIAQRARSLRDHAQSERYFHDEIGYNYRMDRFQTAVLAIKLKQLDSWNAIRVARAACYAKLLKDSSYKLPTHFSDCECVWHCYVIECQDRNRVRHVLQEAGIETGLHYPLPIHLQKAYAFLGYRRGDLPVTEALCDRCLSLPMSADLTDEQISAVVSALRKAAA